MQRLARRVWMPTFFEEIMDNSPPGQFQFQFLIKSMTHCTIIYVIVLVIHTPFSQYVIDSQTHGCPITAVQLQLFVIYLLDSCNWTPMWHAHQSGALK